MFQTDTPFCLQASLAIQKSEILEALQSMSTRRAQPKEQAPAIYWRINPNPIADALYVDFAKRSGPGPIHMPREWRQAFVALLPKPPKPPTTPGNLEQLQTYLAKDQITSYADDMRVAWQISSQAQFRQACIHIGKIWMTLKL